MGYARAATFNGKSGNPAASRWLMTNIGQQVANLSHLADADPTNVINIKGLTDALDSLF